MMSRIESIASEWQSDSELSALNRAAGGEAMTISPELFEILARAKQISADTGGLFDVTFHGVGELWTFTPGSQPRRYEPPKMLQAITGSGGMDNPQGARALYLGNTVYRIHGTNNERTVGRANSSGCFRLANEHVVHLATIAKVGTTVKVLEAYNANVSETPPLSSLFDIFGSEPEATAKPKQKPKKAAQTKKPAPAAASGATAAAPAPATQTQAAAASDAGSAPAAASANPSAPAAETAAKPAEAAPAPQAATDAAQAPAKKAE